MDRIMMVPVPLYVHAFGNEKVHLKVSVLEVPNPFSEGPVVKESCTDNMEATVSGFWLFQYFWCNVTKI